MRKLLYSPWQTLGGPFAFTHIGQLHQSPPSPVPGVCTPNRINPIHSTYPPLPYPIHVFTHETWIDAYLWIGVKWSLTCEWAEERSICISAAFLVLYLWGKEGGSGSRSIERLWHKHKGGVCACVLLVHTAPAKLPAAQYVTTLPSVAKIVTQTWTWKTYDHMYAYTLSVSLFFSRSPFFSLTHSLSLVLFPSFSVSLLVSFFHTHTEIHTSRVLMVEWVLRCISQSAGCEFLDIFWLEALLLLMFEKVNMYSNTHPLTRSQVYAPSHRCHVITPFL